MPRSTFQRLPSNDSVELNAMLGRGSEGKMKLRQVNGEMVLSKREHRTNTRVASKYSRTSSVKGSVLSWKPSAAGGSIDKSESIKSDFVAGPSTPKTKKPFGLFRTDSIFGGGGLSPATPQHTTTTVGIRGSEASSLSTTITRSPSERSERSVSGRQSISSRASCPQTPQSLSPRKRIPYDKTAEERLPMLSEAKTTYRKKSSRSPRGKQNRKFQTDDDLDVSYRMDELDTQAFRRTESIRREELMAGIDGLLETNEEYSSPITRLYQFARKCHWDMVYHEVTVNPRDAKCVCEKDGTTALHLAVMSRSNPAMRDGQTGDLLPAPLDLIEKLIKACPESAIIRCNVKKYTPLSYACLVADRGYDMEDAADMVRIILHYAPESANVFSDDGFSALDVHILSYSRIHVERNELYSPGGRTSTVVLRTLLAENPTLAIARVYKNKLRGPVELLYRCNMNEFRDAVEDENGDVDQIQVKRHELRYSSVTSTLSEWWAWKWTLLLLKFSSYCKIALNSPFMPVHAAARLVGCPLPVLHLAINTFPQQIAERDPRDDLYNLPLHEVCSWVCDDQIISGDRFVQKRKMKAIQCLVEQYPDAARMTNNMGETPLQLAIESSTPWHGGLEILVRACPKALQFPRKLRVPKDENDKKLSIHNTFDLESVYSDDRAESDPIDDIEGMYPFLVAAVLARVPASRLRGPTFHFDDKEDFAAQVVQKELDSLTSVYGLLRANPFVLVRFREDVFQEERGIAL